MGLEGLELLRDAVAQRGKAAEAGAAGADDSEQAGRVSSALEHGDAWGALLCGGAARIGGNGGARNLRIEQ